MAPKTSSKSDTVTSCHDLYKNQTDKWPQSLTETGTLSLQLWRFTRVMSFQFQVNGSQPALPQLGQTDQLLWTLHWHKLDIHNITLYWNRQIKSAFVLALTLLQAKNFKLTGYLSRPLIGTGHMVQVVRGAEPLLATPPRWSETHRRQSHTPQNWTGSTCWSRKTPHAGPLWRHNFKEQFGLTLKVLIYWNILINMHIESTL